VDLARNLGVRLRITCRIVERDKACWTTQVLKYLSLTSSYLQRVACLKSLARLASAGKIQGDEAVFRISESHIELAYKHSVIYVFKLIDRKI